LGGDIAYSRNFGQTVQKVLIMCSKNFKNDKICLKTFP
jgi:hypothetical protein